MRAIHFLLVILIACAITVVSCSKSGSPVAPVEMTDTAQSSWSNRYLLSFNLFRIEPSTGKVEVIPARDTAVHFNVLKFLEIWPCTDCVKVIGLADSDHGTKLIGLALENPFPSPNQTVFDVHGIAMFFGSRSFSVIDKTVPDASLGDGELINADGYTSLYHFGTQLYDTTGYQGYYKGKMATTLAPLAWLQGFKRFWSADPANTRNAFYVGDTVVRTYDIDMPDTTFIFGYAVDANWATPTVKPVTDPMTQFPPEANSPEPWKLQAGEEPSGYGLTDEGGQTTLYIDVYDYQGMDSHSDPVIECPAIFDGIKTPIFAYPGIGFNTWSIVIENEKLAPAGQCKCLIRVVDDANASAPEWLDLTAYHVYTFEVIEAPHGWARTWGNEGFECGFDVAVDKSDSVYTVGPFMGTVDFDPGSGVDNHSSSGWVDCCLTKFNSQGDFILAQTWGGEGYEYPKGVATDSTGNVYVTGYFDRPCDFDPGPGTDIHNPTSPEISDTFLSKFDSDGNYQWVRTWGGTGGECGSAVAADDPNHIYVIGGFGGIVDFDPGPDADLHTAENSASFLCAYDASGDFKWARTWGEGYYDIANGVAIDIADNVYVTGDFSGYVDFDPGPGEDLHIGSIDVYLTKYDADGNFQWAQTWGDSGWDYGYDVATDLDGGIWATGTFEQTVDFDPGSGVEERTAFGYSDAYLTKLDPAGGFMVVQIWGGPWGDVGASLATAGFHQVYMLGYMANNDSVGANYIFVSRYDNGALDWTRAYGGDEGLPNSGQAVAADSEGNAYAVGCYVVPVDFNPDPVEEEIHPMAGWSDAFLTKLLPDGNW